MGSRARERMGRRLFGMVLKFVRSVDRLGLHLARAAIAGSVCGENCGVFPSATSRAAQASSRRDSRGSRRKGRRGKGLRMCPYGGCSQHSGR
jgi:hypothetical protein